MENTVLEDAVRTFSDLVLGGFGLEEFLLSIIIFGWLARGAVFKELPLFVRTSLNRPS